MTNSPLNLVRYFIRQPLMSAVLVGAVCVGSGASGQSTSPPYDDPTNSLAQNFPNCNNTQSNSGLGQLAQDLQALYVDINEDDQGDYSYSDYVLVVSKIDTVDQCCADGGTDQACACKTPAIASEMGSAICP